MVIRTLYMGGERGSAMEHKREKWTMRRPRKGQEDFYFPRGKREGT
jgi:hypothetical protein